MPDATISLPDAYAHRDTDVGAHADTYRHSYSYRDAASDSPLIRQLRPDCLRWLNSRLSGRRSGAGL